MHLPIQVSFDGIECSKAAQAAVEHRAEQLERFYPRVTSCRVVLAAPHRHHHRGRLYSVRVDLTVPGEEIVVNREHPLDHAHESLFVAIRDAFDAVRRRLEDHARVERTQTKAHEAPPHGTVVRLLPEEGYGFIRSSDGTEVYFHRNSVLDGGFDELTVGAPVRFVLEQGEQGPSATSVRLVGRHHHLV